MVVACFLISLNFVKLFKTDHKLILKRIKSVKNWEKLIKNWEKLIKNWEKLYKNWEK